MAKYKKAASPTGKASKPKPAYTAYMKGKKTGGKRTSAYTAPIRKKKAATKKKGGNGKYKLSSASSRAAKKQ
jgi:hypothetical protein